ncbi:MAG: TonB-dependent receptor, partial [Verrucomicrobia bacterium]|nr:TonB-dependent receptor [Verrucomicrobiota bacterium]
SIEAQAYYDRTYRNEAMRSQSAMDTIDLSLQHTFGLGERNDVIWGLGYRFIANENRQTTPLAVVRNSSFDRQLFSAFVQDEFKIVPDRFTVTAGTKLEHNDYTGFEIQPSVRAVFKPTEHQTLWAAVSRAVRTPDDIEASDAFAIAIGAPFTGPGGGQYLPTLVSGSDLKSETLLAYEAGYRVQPCNRLSVDIAAFYNDYRDLTGFGSISKFTPGTPYGTAEIPWVNSQNGHTYGFEASVTVTPMDNLRVIASYSLLRGNVHGVTDNADDPDPQQQVVLRSAYDFTKHASLDAQLRYVGQFDGVPPYVTADIRLSYRPTDRLELSLVGQNLFQDRHLEQAGVPLTVTAEIPRGFYGKITWRF